MRNRPRIQMLSVFALLFMSVVAVALVRSSAVSKGNAQDSRADIEAARRGGLREVARLKGRYVTRVNASTWIKYDLEGLSKNSIAIVVGSPLSSTSRLSSDGESIITEYEVRIDETLKGNLYQTQTTRIEMPGGKVVFEDGSSAEIQTVDLIPMETGKTYLLFLTSTKATPNVFGLTGLGQGLFELTSAGKKVKPHGNQVDVVQKHKDEDISEFVEKVRAAVRKYPKAPQACCN